MAALCLLAGLAWLGLIVWSQAQANRAVAITAAIEDLDILASLAVSAIGKEGGQAEQRQAQLDRFVRSLPASTFANERLIVVADGNGSIVASSPSSPNPVRSLSELFGDDQPLTTLMDKAGVLEVKLRGQIAVIATVRAIPNGAVALLQTRAGILAGLQASFFFQLAIAVATVGTVFALAALLFWQSRRSTVEVDERERVHRRLDASLGHGRCGLWDWSLAKGRIYWSNSTFDLLGYERRSDDISFGELQALVHPDDIDLYRLAEEVAASRLQQVDQEFRIRNAAGEYVWLRIRAELVTDECDGSLHLVGTVLDITAERGRVALDAAADLRLRDAIEAISEAFVLWDADNRLVLCNSKFRDLHELPAEAVLPGQSYADVMQAGRPPVIQHQLSREHPERPGERTMEAQLSDGRWLHINERRTKDGGFVSVGTDISTLKQHETKLMQSETRLLQNVADLRQSREKLHLQAQQLAELAERHLEQKSEAEEASRVKSEFLARMSHELRTPLNAIIGFSEIMASEAFGANDGRYAHYSRDIHRSGHDLLALIDDILDMAQIKAGRIDIATNTVEVAAPIRAALQGVRSQARMKAVTLKSCCAPGTAVGADERALHQILANLVQNAVKFTPRGGIVNVKARRTVTGINIFVADNGIGIAANVLPRLGRPFEQVEAEFNRTYKGPGLGLAIARSLVELHGGGLRIRSQQGQGTVVLVHLPDPVEPDAGALGSIELDVAC